MVRSKVLGPATASHVLSLSNNLLLVCEFDDVCRCLCMQEGRESDRESLLSTSFSVATLGFNDMELHFKFGVKLSCKSGAASLPIDNFSLFGSTLGASVSLSISSAFAVCSCSRFFCKLVNKKGRC